MRDHDIDEEELLKKIETKIDLAGFTKEELYYVNGEKPGWLSSSVYLMMSAFAFGWIIRLIFYSKTVAINYYLKKVILR